MLNYIYKGSRPVYVKHGGAGKYRIIEIATEHGNSNSVFLTDNAESTQCATCDAQHTTNNENKQHTMHKARYIRRNTEHPERTRREGWGGGC